MKEGIAIVRLFLPTTQGGLFESGIVCPASETSDETIHADFLFSHVAHALNLRPRKLVALRYE